MNYILIKDNSSTYPYSLWQFRNDYPLISLPVQPSKEQLNEVGLFEVTELPIPDYNKSVQKVIKHTNPTVVDGLWTIGWDIEDKTLMDYQIERNNMVISPLQAKIALHNVGLLETVESYIQNANTDVIVKLAWANATEFRRMSPMVLNIAYNLNITDTQLDDLFGTGSQVVV